MNRPDLNKLAKDLKVTLKKQWFDRHLKDKHEGYRAITPFWIRRLLNRKDGTRLQRCYKRFSLVKGRVK